MIKVVIIGSGNVAQHLLLAFVQSKIVDVIQVYTRNKNNTTLPLDSNKITSNINALLEADVYFIAVVDNAIKEVSSLLNFSNKLVVHTSGSAAMNVLDDKNRKGVFYPLQTFSKQKKVDFKEIPICIESQNNKDYELLEKIALSISNHVFKINYQQRKALHVSAVFVNNFVNHLYQIGQDICAENNIPFEILRSLILETSNKIISLSPSEAQTGPAIRNDTETINSHLNFLTNNNQKEIYKLITKSIIDHGKKL
jgi:predicted short-subunit dehydrogenase-like oxidoreductase (DUF2520 family)